MIFRRCQTQFSFPRHFRPESFFVITTLVMTLISIVNFESTYLRSKTFFLSSSKFEKFGKINIEIERDLFLFQLSSQDIVYKSLNLKIKKIVLIKNIRFFNFIIFEKFDFYLKIKIHFPKFRIFLVCFWSGNSKIRREIIKKSEFWGNLSCKSKKTFFEKVFYDFKVWNFLTHGVYGRKFLFLVLFRKLKIKKLTHLGKAWNSGHPSLKFLWNNSAKSLRFLSLQKLWKLYFWQMVVILSLEVGAAIYRLAL